MKTAIIIDDELNSIETLKYELNHFSSKLTVIDTCADSRKAKKMIEEQQPDVVFLDIEMPWISGFELLDSLEKINFHLVFTTAYDHFAVKAFEYFTIDYLLKPVSKSALQRTMEKIKKVEQTPLPFDMSNIINIVRQQQKLVKKIALPVRNGYQFYDHNNIIRCEADSNYTKVFVINEKPILISKSLKVIADMLNESNFFRPHQSHLINLDYLKKYEKADGGIITMQDGSSIPISRHKKTIFIELLK